MRHVVLQTLDTQVVIVPNSKLNGMRIRNYSYHMNIRSNQFEFEVAYDTDVEKAISVIRQAVIDSPLTIPGKEMEDGMEYAQVYFLGYQESSLRLATTVYFEATSPSEVVISDINLRVGKALKEAASRSRTPTSMSLRTQRKRELPEKREKKIARIRPHRRNRKRSWHSRYKNNKFQTKMSMDSGIVSRYTGIRKQCLFFFDQKWHCI